LKAKKYGEVKDTLEDFAGMRGEVIFTSTRLLPACCIRVVVITKIHHTRFGFAMKPTTWSKFLGGHWFASDDCEIKLDSKKIDLDAYIDGTPPSRLKRKKFYIVRIGNKTERSPNKIEEQMGQDGRLIATPHD